MNSININELWESCYELTKLIYDVPKMYTAQACIKAHIILDNICENFGVDIYDNDIEEELATSWLDKGLNECSKELRENIWSLLELATDTDEEYVRDILNAMYDDIDAFIDRYAMKDYAAAKNRVDCILHAGTFTINDVENAEELRELTEAVIKDLTKAISNI